MTGIPKIDHTEKHVHQWIPFKSVCEGFFSKRGDASDANWYRGHVMECAGPACDMFLFTPFNPALKPVECVLATDQEIQTATAA